jgi:hypothetical protein
MIGNGLTKFMMIGRLVQNHRLLLTFKVAAVASMDFLTFSFRCCMEAFARYLPKKFTQSVNYHKSYQQILISSWQQQLPWI